MFECSDAYYKVKKFISNLAEKKHRRYNTVNIHCYI